MLSGNNSNIHQLPLTKPKDTDVSAGGVISGRDCTESKQTSEHYIATGKFAVSFVTL